MRQAPAGIVREGKVYYVDPGCASIESTRFQPVMAGLVPAIPKSGRRALLNEIAGTSPAMTNAPLRLLPRPVGNGKRLPT
jgi:hypothetical protein